MPVFTLEEATRLLPWLSQRLDRLAQLREAQTRRQAELEESRLSARSNGGGSQESALEQREKQMQRIAGRVERLAGGIAIIGIIVRDPVRGLVDFPSIRDGREVYLCWLKGEPSIGFWHEVDVGFAERQPL